ncbi:unnamed protein product [Paramecium primaurelia]|uniref:Protein kinase domain-containing protein n=1 Tax=Paramecium primaurelia TaxID=5886 RepID=A0A8S1MIF2_PARPR|nr:unnamed protein product [Paramecium primaurelia]
MFMSQDDQDYFFSDEDDQISQIIEQDSTGRFCKYNEEIGKGAYKSVFRGYDNQSGCEVAWNVFQLNSVPENERRRVRQEISILSSLKHNNIINFIHSWHNKSKKEIVFITEIINGGSLKNYLRRITRPKLKVIKNWCRQILLGLEYLHKQNIIHRDLKCENLLIDTNNNELKIGDLGLSIQLQQSFTTSVLGTPEFMAPEIYQEHYDTKVDIYAFGMCLLEMVTGVKPFCECKGGTGQVIKKVIEQQKPQSIDAILNDKIKAIILECLKPPEERPSATQLLSTHFNVQVTDNDNFPVPINDQFLMQLKDDSKNSSILKCNLSNKIMLTTGSSKFETNSEISIQKQSQLLGLRKKNLIIQTEDETEQIFNKCYKDYICYRNDESLNDLEQRQEKELQLLKQFHLQQKQEYLKKTSNNVNVKTSTQPFQSSGFLSPGSYQNFFDFQQDSIYPKQIIESPCLDKNSNNRLLKLGMITDNSSGVQQQLSQSQQVGIQNQIIVDKQLEVNN